MNEVVSSGGILIVDDDQGALDSANITLRSQGFGPVVTCNDSRKVEDILEKNPDIVLVLLDMIMPHRSGEEVLSAIKSGPKEKLAVIVVTADHQVDTVARCMRTGAIDYLAKPVSSDLLIERVKHALHTVAVEHEANRLRSGFFEDTLEKPEAFTEILTSDPLMFRVFAYVEAVSRGTEPVLIIGETGTGKELIANALHLAGRRQGEFVAVNTSGLDEQMFSDTLFGHAAGAYTGATGRRAGMIEKAGSGTLFLDEIGDLQDSAQVKLLRVLQEREYSPLGTDKTKPLSARVVAATHQPENKLRKDLFYRLRGYKVRLPPLRERQKDLPLLVDLFAAEAAKDLDRPVPQVTPELLTLLSRYHFPGNVRELRSMTLHAVALSGEKLELKAFEELMEVAPETPSEAQVSGRVLKESEIQELDRANIERALSKAKWKVSGPGGAAELLGLNPNTLASRMTKHGLRRD